jgi:hypothetical protein
MNRLNNNSSWRRTHIFFDDLAQYQTPLSAPHSAVEFFVTMNDHFHLHHASTTRKGGIRGYHFI